MNVNLPSTFPRVNSHRGMERRSFLRIFYNGEDKVSIALDAAEGGEVRLEVVDSSGAPVAGKPSIVLNLDDLTGTNKSATFRQFSWKDATTCTMKTAWFLMTEPETP